jgi:micrococcal nuclease
VALVLLALVWAALVVVALCTAEGPAPDAEAGRDARAHGRSVPLRPGGATRGSEITPPRDAARVRVVRIVDGDTLVVRAGDRSISVRLLGVDAPELPRARPPLAATEAGRPGCAGRAARSALSRMAPPGVVLYVTTDREVHDPYGRSLLYAWTARRTFVNAALIRDGHARALVIPPNDRFAGVFRAAEAAARRAPGGGGSACAGAIG